MEDLIIEGTATIPSVTFKVTGEIKMEGRALPENASSLFEPMINWAKKIEVEDVNIEFNLDYYNTSVSKQLYDLFKAFNENIHVKSISVLWLYEDGDDEMLEAGEVYRDILPRFKFTFQKYAEILE